MTPMQFPLLCRSKRMTGGGFCIIGANAVVKKIDSDSTLF